MIGGIVLRITELHVKGFRCFEELHLKDLGKFVVLVGANGSGKSSIVELLTRAPLDFSQPSATFLPAEFGQPGPNWPTIIVGMDSEEIKYFVTPDIWGEFQDVWSQRNETTAPLTYQGEAHWSEDQMRLHAYLRRRFRARVIRYSPTRAIEFPRTVSLTAPNLEEGMYVSDDSSHFRNRVRYLHQRLASLIVSRHFEGGRQYLKGLDSETLTTLGSYFELREIKDVFDLFFGLTGKRFSEPRFENGEFSFFFEVPWRRELLPLSALSSGEQWVLLFFVEMALNNWTSHIILIDELEQHLHPHLARMFISALQEREDKNQYWITTHSPMVVQQLRSSTYGLVMDREGRSSAIPYKGHESEVIRSYAGVEGLIPIGTTVVFLEGTAPEGYLQSVDQTFFSELQRTRYVPPDIQFISVGHSRSVESYQEMLSAFESQMGLGLKFFAIRDRDAMSDETRRQAMKAGKGHLWIWQRGSIEGYLIEPALISRYFEVRGWETRPTPEEVEKAILALLASKKREMESRYENRLIESVLPVGRKATIDTLTALSDETEGLRNRLNLFRQNLDALIRSRDWRSLLAYADCKTLLESLICNLGGLGPDPNKPETTIDLVQRMFREVVAGYDIDPIRLDKELVDVLSGIVNGNGFSAFL